MTIPDHSLLRTLKDEHNQLKQQNRDLIREREHLRQVINRINAWNWDLSLTEGSLQDIMSEVLATALFAVSSSNGSLLLFDEEEDELVFVTVIGESEEMLVDYRIPAQTGVAGWVLTNRKPALVQNVRDDDRWLPAVDQSIGFKTKCLVAVPLLLGERAFGVIEVVNSTSEDPFDTNDLELLQLVGTFSSYLFGYLEVSSNPDQTSLKTIFPFFSI